MCNRGRIDRHGGPTSQSFIDMNNTRFPAAMQDYIENYGWHFNKKAVEFAVSLMKRKDKSGELKPIEPLHKEEVDEILERQGIRLDKNKLCDYIYVANKCRADYKKSVPDEQHLALYIQETIDDVDAGDETVFREWLAKMRGCHQPVDFNELI